MRCWYRIRKGRKSRASRATVPPFLITLLAAVLVAGGVIRFTEKNMRPTVTALAQVQAQNQVRSLVEMTVVSYLQEKEITYGSLVTIDRNEMGEITALSSNTAALNLLRSQLVERIWQVLSENRACVVQIPVGNLLKSEFMWGKGPAFAVEAIVFGGVSAEFQSEFSTAGINQTLHKIELNLSVPVAMMLPGGRIELSVDTLLPIAETVVVGQIPDTYLQLAALPASG